MAVLGVIPARLESTRLPRKLLLCESGKPLLQHTWERAAAASALTDLVIATDSDEIAGEARTFGAKVAITGHHNCGTERVAETAERWPSELELVVNVQGDEPLLDPESIDELVRTLRSRKDCQVATLGTAFVSTEQYRLPSCVKVLTTESGDALYFTRAMIPYSGSYQLTIDELRSCGVYRHVGIYAYRPPFLRSFIRCKSPLIEKFESLEQFRFFNLGAKVAIALCEHHSTGIDTRTDYDAFLQTVSSWSTNSVSAQQHH